MGILSGQLNVGYCDDPNCESGTWQNSLTSDVLPTLRDTETLLRFEVPPTERFQQMIARLDCLILEGRQGELDTKLPDFSILSITAVAVTGPNENLSRFINCYISDPTHINTRYLSPIQN
jgi:hypothetical protein